MESAAVRAAFGSLYWLATAWRVPVVVLAWLASAAAAPVDPSVTAKAVLGGEKGPSVATPSGTNAPGVQDGWPIVAAGTFQACGGVVPCEWALGDAPGLLANLPLVNPTRPVRRGPAIMLPVPGIYEFTDQNQRRAVVALGDSARLNAEILHGFVAGMSTGSSEENGSYRSGKQRFVHALFYRTQASAVNCGPSSRALKRLLDEAKIESRILQWVGHSEEFAGHQSIEVLLPEGWTVYDAHLGLIFRAGFSALDLFEAYERGDSISAELTLVLPKATWMQDPWNAYSNYRAAVGIIVDDREVLLASGATASDARRALEHLPRKGRLLERSEFRRRFYATLP